MEDELKEMYKKAIKKMSECENGTELFGYWLGKASAINEILTL